MKKRWLAFCLILILLFCVGCGGRADNSAQMRMKESEMYASAGAEMTDMAFAAEPMMAVPMQDGYSSGGGEGGIMEEQAPEPDYGGRKIIRTLSLEMETGEFDKQTAQLARDVKTAGGYVQNSYIYGTKPVAAGDPGRSANYVLRIPETQADAFIKAASAYGSILSQNEDTEDVTDSYFDIETRLEVNRSTLERMKSILTNTAELSDS